MRPFTTITTYFFLLGLGSVYSQLPSLRPLDQENFSLLKHHVNTYLTNSWCSTEKSNLIMDHIVLTKPNICVEIGVGTGSSFLPIVASLSYLNKGVAYAIDSWSNHDAVEGIPSSDLNYAWWLNVNMNDLYTKFGQSIDEWSLYQFCEIIRSSSKNAVSRFSQIDFLHIDGNFSERGSLEDVLMYLPKVAPNGYILLSNVFVTINGELTKMDALNKLLEVCTIIAEIENSNTILFKKTE